MGGLAFIFAGERLFPLIGFPETPVWFGGVQRNRIGAAAGVWIIGNTFNNGLISTGAFEIYHGDQILFSKLKENRTPTHEELISVVSSALRRPPVHSSPAGSGHAELHSHPPGQHQHHHHSHQDHRHH
eukprot:TRINITY_DN6537_c0_g1_i1.p1 TRINITY_DN6537_c0_g1~~TRINITY_DN6537_c0_g1_i1.p1  ORF type:complete len:128 (+),score=21.88 TRINITY_DN6537_c0_g1_i1:482-865(+)